VDRLDLYNEFLDIMTSYEIHQEEARTVDMLYNLFQGSRPKIIRSFNSFLSPWLNFETPGHDLIPHTPVRSTISH
jgi:histone deacetylase complex regulatory component SIN3